MLLICFLFQQPGVAFADKFQTQNKAFQKAWYYRHSRPDSLFIYALHARRDAVQLSDSLLRIKSDLLLNEYYINVFRFKKARRYLADAKSVSNSIFHPELEIEVLNGFYKLYDKAGKADSAYLVLMKACNIASRVNNAGLLAIIYNNIGNLYAHNKNTAKALYYLNKSLNAWKSEGSPNYTGILSDIGNVYYWDSQFTQAKSYYLQAYNHANSTNDLLGTAYSASNLAMAQEKSGELNAAEKNYKTAFAQYNKCDNAEGRINVALHLTRLYSLMDKLPAAQQWLAVASASVNKIGKKEYLFEYYITKGELAEKMHDFALATKSYKTGLFYQDSLLAANPSLKMNELQTRYDLSEQKEENRILKEQKAKQSFIIEKQNLTTTLSILLLLISVFTVWYVARTSKARKKVIVQLSKQNELIEKQNLELAGLNVEMQMQKRNLEQSLEFKNKLFSIVSHDVRSPMISLQELLTLIAEGEDLPKELMKELLGDVAERVQVTSNFLENLLSWAKSQLDGYASDVRNVELFNESKTIIELFSRIANEKQIRIENKIGKDIKASCDLNLFRLVMRNLISNAIKFTPPKGGIEISARYEDSRLIVSVHDNGVGMSDQTIRKIFRGQGYTSLGTSNEKGTGLGLTLCKDFIQKMNGKLWVESTPGQGSIFSFSLPVQKRSFKVA